MKQVVEIARLRLWRSIHNRSLYSYVGSDTACGWALPICTSVQVATCKVVNADCCLKDIPQLSERSQSPDCKPDREDLSEGISNAGNVRFSPVRETHGSLT